MGNDGRRVRFFLLVDRRRSVLHFLVKVPIALHAIIEIFYRWVRVAFGGPDAPPTIGAHAVEAFLLGVDPEQKRLVTLEGWWATS